MSMLANIKSTKESYPGIRVIVAGVEKVGKTTFVCGAPNALLIPLEAGYSNQNIKHVPMVEDYSSLVSLLMEVTTACQLGQFPFKTLVLDSLTALERLIHEGVLALDPLYKKGAAKSISMDNALGGYGRAFQLANERFIEVVKLLDILSIKHSINIVMTCHVFSNVIIDPQVGEYSSWDLLLHSPKNQKTYGKREVASQWVDAIFFLHEPIMIVEQNSIKKGISENRGRMLGLSRTPSYCAGNRFGLEGEISIPKEQGWNYLAQAMHESCGLDVYKR
jgi:hypothetical protein